MSNRVKGFEVLLSEDMREDDVQPVIDAIQMIKGVQDVKVVESDSGDWMNRERIRNEFREKLWEAFNEKLT